MVGDAVPFTDCLEPSQDRLAQMALKIRLAVAAEDPTRGEAVLVDRAVFALLVRTSAGGHRLQCSRLELRGQVDQLGWRDEEPVVVSLEIATGPARLAAAGTSRVPPKLGVDPIIEDRYFLDESAASLGSSHHRLFFLILSISSKL